MPVAGFFSGTLLAITKGNSKIKSGKNFVRGAQRVLDRIFLLFNKTWKELHQAKKVKYISNFFPVSNTNVKFWQMLKNIFVNKMAKFQCLQYNGLHQFYFNV